MLENKELLYIKKEGIQYLSYQKLNELGIANAFSLKGLDFRDKEGMEEEYQKLLSAMEIPYQNLVKLHAKHTDHILIIDEKQNKNTADIRLPYLDEIDGLITKRKNIALATTSADCLCMILYDPQKEVLANVHSGWRGTFQKIGQKALVKMIENFDCNPKDILVFFMPAIRQCHFEVDEDVMLECKRIFEYTNQIPQIIHIGRKLEDKQKYLIDNILINQLLLQEKGILAQNIYDSGICSVCHCDIVNSRRADGEEFALATTIAMMKEPK